MLFFLVKRLKEFEKKTRCKQNEYFVQYNSPKLCAICNNNNNNNKSNSKSNSDTTTTNKLRLYTHYLLESVPL